MTAKRFEVTPEMPEGWVDIVDTDNDRTLCNIRVEYANNMIELLNELYESNKKAITLINEAIIEALDGAKYNVVDLLEKAIEELEE